MTQKIFLFLIQNKINKLIYLDPSMTYAQGALTGTSQDLLLLYFLSPLHPPTHSKKREKKNKKRKEKPNKI